MGPSSCARALSLAKVGITLSCKAIRPPTPNFWPSAMLRGASTGATYLIVTFTRPLHHARCAKGRCIGPVSAAITMRRRQKVASRRSWPASGWARVAHAFGAGPGSEASRLAARWIAVGPMPARPHARAGRVRQAPLSFVSIAVICDDRWPSAPRQAGGRGISVDGDQPASSPGMAAFVA